MEQTESVTEPSNDTSQDPQFEVLFLPPQIIEYYRVSLSSGNLPSVLSALPGRHKGKRVARLRPSPRREKALRAT